MMPYQYTLTSTLFPYTTLFRSSGKTLGIGTGVWLVFMHVAASLLSGYMAGRLRTKWVSLHTDEVDRKSTRLNSSHSQISYAVFCLKKKKIRSAFRSRPAQQ